jgi:hypothetical protein
MSQQSMIKYPVESYVLKVCGTLAGWYFFVGDL